VCSHRCKERRAVVKLVVRWRPLALSGLLLLALALRLYGLNWDSGNSFHPDERQILFHVTALAWPQNIAEFLDAARSPLNPHFFAYGTFPMYLLAALGALLGHFWPALTSFANLTLVGRVLSALFDSGTVLLTALLALRLIRDDLPGRPRAWNVALLAAALVAFTPLQLQLSHFFAVDSILLSMVMLALLACVELVQTEKVWLWSVVAGVAYGLAMGTKISAAPLAVPICVAFLLRWRTQRDFMAQLSSLIFTGLITILVFLIAGDGAGRSGAWPAGLSLRAPVCRDGAVSV
jgi:hypothetical protein